MRYRSEHKVQTRARVLSEAVQAIRIQGPRGLSVEQVMSKAGLTHGGFYSHFSSRDDLVAEAATKAFGEGAALFERVIGDKPPWDALRAYVDYYLSPEHREAIETGCPIPSMTSDLSRGHSKAGERFADGIARLHQRIEALLTAADVQNAPMAASSLIAELIGAVTLSRAIPDREQSDAVLFRSRMAILNRIGMADLR